MDELSDTILYNENDKDFYQQIEILNQPLNLPTIYSDKNPQNKKYTGNIINGKYNGRGILYDENSGKIIYNGFFKEGKYDGFGKEYNNYYYYDQIYIGYFCNNKYKGKGILYKKGIKIYEGYFLNGYYHGIGTEYLSNGNRKRRLIYVEGKIRSKCYGILFNENNEEQYKGLLVNGRPEKGKSLTFYGENDYIIYKGDFSNFMYNGEGILYYEKENKILFKGIFKDDKYSNGILYFNDGSKQFEGEFFNNIYNGKGTLFFKGNNKKYYEGTFNNGKYKYGILYDPKGEIIYEGEYKNNLPKEGYNIELYKLDGYLKYKGGFFDFKYHKYGKLYFNNNELSYEGEFKNGDIHGFGRLYEIDKNFRHYLYYKGNFINNEIYGKGIKYYINGSKKIEGNFESIYSYEGNYYNPKGELIYNNKIINEIPMDSKNIILFNDLGLKFYDGNIYNRGYKKKIQINNDINTIRRKKTNILFASQGYPGKTNLILSLKGEKYSEVSLGTIGCDVSVLDCKYNNIQYKLKLIEVSGAERFKSLAIQYFKIADIIIYLFDLSKDDDISEEFINGINNEVDKVIYLVGNKLDLIVNNIKKYRKQAKILIDRGKVHRYFELSAKTGYGIDLFLEHLKIDSVMILDNGLYSLLEENIEIKYDSQNKNNKRNNEMKYNLLKYYNL